MRFLILVFMVCGLASIVGQIEETNHKLDRVIVLLDRGTAKN